MYIDMTSVDKTHGYLDRMQPDKHLNDLNNIELKFKKGKGKDENNNEFALLIECKLVDKLGKEKSVDVNPYDYTYDTEGNYKKSYDGNWFLLRMIIKRNYLNSNIKYCLFDEYKSQNDYPVRWLTDLSNKLPRKNSINEDKPIMNENLNDWKFELSEDKETETVTITYTRKNIGELLSSRLGGKRRRKTAKKQRKSRKSRKNRTMKFW